MSALPFRVIGEAEKGGIVTICDHASNHVPADIGLGIAPELLEKHIGWDIGTAGVAEELARRHAMPGFLASVSRLVIDLNREEDSPGLIPDHSDGHAIPGNQGTDREARLERFHRPYHRALEQWLERMAPRLVLSIHSFTPVLERAPEQYRPWEIGLLYNEDGRAAREAIRLFAERGFNTGDNQPYSGRLLNATMNRHAEAHGRDYCTIEIRNDLIADEAAQARLADIIAEVARDVVRALDGEAAPARSWVDGRDRL